MGYMGRISEKSVKWEGLPKTGACSNKKGRMGSFFGKKISKRKYFIEHKQ